MVTSQFSVPVRRNVGVELSNMQTVCPGGGQPWSRPPTGPPATPRLPAEAGNWELTTGGSEKVQRECHPFDGVGESPLQMTEKSEAFNSFFYLSLDQKVREKIPVDQTDRKPS